MAGLAGSLKLKVCLAGESAVGKTSVIRRFVEDAFDDRHIVTMGAKVTKKEMHTRLPGSGEAVRTILTIWDIVGHAGFKDFIKGSFFRGSQGILAVCDVTRPMTLGRLEGWMEAIRSTAGEIPAYLLANKVDLEAKAQLWEEDIEAFGAERGIPHRFTSAKTGEGV
ncbi:MAG: Rab family GTPase, partial [Thermoplasmata archaeon]|nr:Rab family GTPase [Thermoplasmata archaeon]